MRTGRPRQFDESEVLDRAVELFWHFGYEGVSVTGLCEDLGICSQSLYNTFGSKRELFHRSLERYSTQVIDPMVEQLQDRGEPLRAVRSWIEGWREHHGSGPPAGCLLGNTAAQFGVSDARTAALVTDGARRIHTALTGALECAAERGALDRRAQSAELAGTLLSMLFGLALLSRVGMAPELVEQSIAGARALVGRRGPMESET
jgi:TetR/AcrR family transcriptional repressor of nem operon